MKASEIKLGNEIRIETTNDAVNVWPLNTKGGQEWHRDNYIKWYGDVDVEYDEQFNVYRVPAFADKIKAYCDNKAEYCERWGSD